MFAALVVAIALVACTVQGVQGMTDAEKAKQDSKHAVEEEYDAWLGYWEAKQDAKDAAELKGRRTSEVASSNSFVTSMKKTSKKSSKKATAAAPTEGGASTT